MSSDIQCLYCSARRRLALLIKMNEYVVNERTCMLYNINQFQRRLCLSKREVDILISIKMGFIFHGG